MRIDPNILSGCWLLAGPTASGKTATALELADLLGAEIISADSMALYRGMDIGTAKPTADEQQRIPHHLVDILDPHEEFNVAQYLQEVEVACRDILSRNRIPLFVGGTGLYVRSILRGVFEGPPADWPLRRRLEADAVEQSPGYLHDRLRTIDPAAAERLHANDTRRIIRALEVYELTGVPLSQQQQETPLPAEQRPRAFWLLPPRDRLYEQIDARVLEMFDAGLTAEVKNLLQAERTLSRTARQALGYKETIDHLNGELALDETIARIQQQTRRFAKRQHTWFRHLEELSPIAITGRESPTEIAQRLIESDPT